MSKDTKPRNLPSQNYSPNPKEFRDVQLEVSSQTLAASHNFFWFIDMRVGKTGTSIATMLKGNYDVCIMATQSGLMYDYYQGCLDFGISSERLIIINEYKPSEYQEMLDFAINNKMIIISSYDILGKLQIKKAIPNSIFFIDEVDKVGFDSRKLPARARNLQRIIKLVTKTVFMTGSPYRDHDSRFIKYARALGNNLFNGYWKELEYFFYMELNARGVREPSTLKNPAEFEKYLNNFVIVRKWEEVYDYDNSVELVIYRINDKDEELLKEFEIMTKTYLLPGHTDPYIKSDAVMAMRKIEFTLSPKLLGFDFVSQKEKSLKSILNGNKDKSIIIFSKSSKFVQKLGNDYNIATIHGGISAPRRKEVERKFQDLEYKVIAATTETAGAGFTFDTADLLIFMDLGYKLSSFKQTLKRITPSSAERVKQRFVYIMYHEKIDESMAQALMRKHKGTELIRNIKGRDVL